MRDWSKADWVDPQHNWKPLPVSDMPERLLIAYRDQVLAHIRAWESELAQSSEGLLARLRQEKQARDEV